jgi:hypothetical protein
MNIGQRRESLFNARTHLIPVQAAITTTEGWNGNGSDAKFVNLGYKIGEAYEPANVPWLEN